MSKRVKPSLFKTVKKLESLKVGSRQIAAITELSTQTIYRMQKVNTWEEYRALIQSLNPHNQRKQNIPVIDADEEAENPTTSDEHIRAIRELTQAVRQLTKSLGV